MNEHVLVTDKFVKKQSLQDRPMYFTLNPVSISESFFDFLVIANWGKL